MRKLLVFAALAAWLKLVLFHGKFWQKGPTLQPKLVAHDQAPKVVAIIPARNEAEVVQATLSSLLAQDYPGDLKVILVDDCSTDETVQRARAVPDPEHRLTIIQGAPHPAGWSGKLWAVHQGEREAAQYLSDDDYVLFSDADILHAATHLQTLVAKAKTDALDLVSEMVSLNCVTPVERALIPAFVYFFTMIYPFARVNDPKASTAGAAGGTILLKWSALRAMGGVSTIKEALIDDCRLAKQIKRGGGRLYLGHSGTAWSIRPYRSFLEIWVMIKRTAYVQLKRSPLALIGASLGMAGLWGIPFFATLFMRGRARFAGFAALSLSLASFLPSLARFSLSPLRALSLPLVALFYMAATVGSAVDHHFRGGARWKERSYRGQDL